MASAILGSTTGPLATTSHSRQNHLNQQRALSSAGGAYEDQETDNLLSPHISFDMSQGSQGGGLMMQPRPISQYDGGSFVRHRDVAPQIYSVRDITSPGGQGSLGRDIKVFLTSCTGRLFRS